MVLYCSKIHRFLDCILFVYILWLGSQPCPPRASTMMMPAIRYPGPQWNNVVSQQVAEAHFQKRELPSIVNVADISHCIANPGSCHFHVVQCCGSWMFIPDPNFSFPDQKDPGSA
jgi:hypothetical protein